MATATTCTMVTATRWWATKRAMARAATAMTTATKGAMVTASRAKNKVGPKKSQCVLEHRPRDVSDS